MFSERFSYFCKARLLRYLDFLKIENLTLYTKFLLSITVKFLEQVFSRLLERTKNKHIWYTDNTHVQGIFSSPKNQQLVQKVDHRITP